MLALILGMILGASQLTGPGGGLPQILHPDFNTVAPVKAGKRADSKAKDQYYVDLPTLKVPLTATKAGKYEIPGKLKYFFCNKADGFCSFQVLDVKIPLSAE
jgi:hypothetical protein